MVMSNEFRQQMTMQLDVLERTIMEVRHVYQTQSSNITDLLLLADLISGLKSTYAELSAQYQRKNEQDDGIADRLSSLRGEIEGLDQALMRRMGSAMPSDAVMAAGEAAVARRRRAPSSGLASSEEPVFAASAAASASAVRDSLIQVQGTLEFAHEKISRMPREIRTPSELERMRQRWLERFKQARFSRLQQTALYMNTC